MLHCSFVRYGLDGWGSFSCGVVRDFVFTTISNMVLWFIAFSVKDLFQIPAK
jgi:hypothetical protein